VTAGLLRLEGAALVSSLRQFGGAVEIRLFNPLTRAATAKLVVTDKAFKPKQASLTDFEGNAKTKLSLTGGKVSLTLKPKQIVTVRLA